MHLTRHRLAKTVILLLVMAVFGLALSSARTAQVHAAKVRCSASLTYVPNVPVICEQIRYVRETLRLPYQDYVARANDFRDHGCTNPPWRRPSQEHCTKPRPYDSFDWQTDGCTHTPAPENLVFNRPCQLHDFGYSNVGSGLLAKTTYHSAKNRKYVDQRFKDEMYAICKDPRAFLVVGGDYLKCRAVAYGMWKAVRKANPEW